MIDWVATTALGAGQCISISLSGVPLTGLLMLSSCVGFEQHKAACFYLLISCRFWLSRDPVCHALLHVKATIMQNFPSCSMVTTSKPARPSCSTTGSF